ncbi:hypothetical protein RSSE_c0596 [Ralstonia solanacearum]|nr:hypothetical protein RSSE_c0596 [Ralstonia solanacearum]
MSASRRFRPKVSISERRACRLVGLSRSVLHYEAQTAPGNEILKARLVELAHERRRFGYRRLHVLLERRGSARESQTRTPVMTQ